MIEIECPHCLRKVSFRDLLAGLSVKCPECPRFVQVTPRTPLPIHPKPEPAPEAITSEPIPLAPPIESPVSMERDLDIRLRTSPWPRRLKWLGSGLLLLAVTAPVMCLDRRSVRWDVSLLIAACVIIVMTFVALRRVELQPARKGTLFAFVMCILFGWMVIEVWNWTGSTRLTATIHIENASTQEVKIELDGGSWRTSFPSRTRVVQARPGEHRITVRSAAGDILQELEVTIEDRGAYVLNVLKAQTYCKGSVVYGNDLALLGVEEEGPRMVKGGWIDVTKVDYLFRDPPPSIMVRVGENAPVHLGSEIRTYLTRKTHPCERP